MATLRVSIPRTILPKRRLQPSLMARFATGKESSPAGDKPSTPVVSERPTVVKDDRPSELPFPHNQPDYDTPIDHGTS